MKNSPPATRRHSVLTTAVTVAILAIVAVMMVFTNISVSFGETELKLKGDIFSSAAIAYSDIAEVALRDNFAPGGRSFGASTLNVYSGTFQNAEFGKYKNFTYKSVPQVIVVHHTGGVLVFSGEDAASTEALYATLCKKTAG